MDWDVYSVVWVENFLCWLKALGRKYVWSSCRDFDIFFSEWVLWSLIYVVRWSSVVYIVGLEKNCGGVKMMMAENCMWTCIRF